MRCGSFTSSCPRAHGASTQANSFPFPQRMPWRQLETHVPSHRTRCRSSGSDGSRVPLPRMARPTEKEFPAPCRTVRCNARSPVRDAQYCRHRVGQEFQLPRRERGAVSRWPQVLRARRNVLNPRSCRIRLVSRRTLSRQWRQRPSPRHACHCASHLRTIELALICGNRTCTYHQERCAIGASAPISKDRGLAPGFLFSLVLAISAL